MLSDGIEDDSKIASSVSLDLFLETVDERLYGIILELLKLVIKTMITRK